MIEIDSKTIRDAMRYFQAQPQQDFMAEIKWAVERAEKATGAKPTHIKVSPRTYTLRVRFLEKALNKEGLTVVVAGLDTSVPVFIVY